MQKVSDNRRQRRRQFLKGKQSFFAHKSIAHILTNIQIRNINLSSKQSWTSQFNFIRNSRRRFAISLMLLLKFFSCYLIFTLSFLLFSFTSSSKIIFHNLFRRHDEDMAIMDTTKNIINSSIFDQEMKSIQRGMIVCC